MTMPDFPNAPYVGQEFTTGGVTYTYDGTAWLKQGSPADLPALLQGYVTQALDAVNAAAAQASIAQAAANDAADAVQECQDIVAGIGGTGLVPDVTGVPAGHVLATIGTPPYGWVAPVPGTGPIGIKDLIDVDHTVPPSKGAVLEYDVDTLTWLSVPHWPVGAKADQVIGWHVDSQAPLWVDAPKELPAIVPSTDQGKVVGVQPNDKYGLINQTGGVTYNTAVPINASRALTPADLQFDRDIEVDSSGGAINLTIPANLFVLASDATKRRGVGIYKVSNDANAVNLVPQSGLGPPNAHVVQLGHDVSGAPLIYKTTDPDSTADTSGERFTAALPTQNFIAPAGNDRVLITWCIIGISTTANNSAYFAARSTTLTIDGASVTPLFSFNQGENGSRYVQMAFGFKKLSNAGAPTNHTVVWSTNQGARSYQAIITDCWKDVWDTTPLADGLRDPDPTFLGDVAAGETTPTRKATFTSTRSYSTILSMMAVHFGSALVSSEGGVSYVPDQTTGGSTNRDCVFAGRKSQMTAPGTAIHALRKSSGTTIERGNWIGVSLQAKPTSLIGTVIRVDDNASAQLTRPYQAGLLRAASDGTTYYFYAR